MKNFYQTSILGHFNPERYVYFKIDTLEYTIDRVFNLMTINHSDQPFSNYVIHKNLNLNSFKIGQWHLIAFFF